MTPETAQAVSDIMNSPAMAATIGLALVALGTAALVVMKRGQKTEADVTAARRELRDARKEHQQQIAVLSKKVLSIGADLFVSRLQVENRNQVIRELQQQIANLKKANEQLAKAQDERRNGQ